MIFISVFNESFKVSIYSDYDNIVYKVKGLLFIKSTTSKSFVSRAIRGKLNIQELTTISRKTLSENKRILKEFAALGDDYTLFWKVAIKINNR